MPQIIGVAVHRILWLDSTVICGNMGFMPRTAHPHRQLHLIDAENLSREARPSLLTASTVRDLYEELVGPEASDPWSSPATTEPS